MTGDGRSGGMTFEQWLADRVAAEYHRRLDAETDSLIYGRRAEPAGDYRSTRGGITVEIAADWFARPAERDIAGVGLGFCEFCEMDIVPGQEIASVNDGRYAHWGCVPWDDDQDEEDE